MEDFVSNGPSAVKANCLNERSLNGNQIVVRQAWFFD